jgi:hemerythrin-like domain-containing protein
MALAHPGGGSPAGAEARPGKGRPAEVTPGEDLMQEHGALERVLLCYEACLHRLRSGKGGTPLQAIVQGADIVRRFISDYHEKLEEDFVFPRLEKAGKETALVATLRLQHQRGRLLTARLHGLASKGARRSVPTRIALEADLAAFIRMYRPHAAREDTVLFPAFREVVGTDAAYRELGERFEEREHQVLGKEGFEGIVEEVTALEEQLGIADLDQFTPPG